MIEIRWHGRGGQGAKTAALLLADGAFEAGLYVQGFPEYGPERMGAPITAYTRLDDKPIRIHSGVYEPDMVVVVDETLIFVADVQSGLKKGGRIVINTNRRPELIAQAFKGGSYEIYTIDATGISLRILGKNLPNVALLSVVANLTGVIGRDEFFHAMESALEAKFATRPDVIAGNMNALREAWSGAVRVNGD